MKKVESNISFQINGIHENLTRIESFILKLEKKIDLLEKRTVNHLCRIKNNDLISDTFLMDLSTYNDLSPTQSKQILGMKDYEYILLDVSDSKFFAPVKFKKSIKATLEQLHHKLPEVLNKITPIYIISEDGTKSVLACDYLNSLGYFNINNISGGYKYWPKSQKSSNQKAA